MDGAVGLIDRDDARGDQRAGGQERGDGGWNDACRKHDHEPGKNSHSLGGARAHGHRLASHEFG